MFIVLAMACASRYFLFPFCPFLLIVVRRVWNSNESDICWFNSSNLAIGFNWINYEHEALTIFFFLSPSLLQLICFIFLLPFASSCLVVSLFFQNRKNVGFVNVIAHISSCAINKYIFALYFYTLVFLSKFLFDFLFYLWNLNEVSCWTEKEKILFPFQNINNTKKKWNISFISVEFNWIYRKERNNNNDKKVMRISTTVCAIFSHLIFD